MISARCVIKCRVEESTYKKTITGLTTYIKCGLGICPYSTIAVVFLTRLREKGGIIIIPLCALGEPIL